MEPEYELLPVAAGRGARQLRLTAGVTLERVAQAAKFYGLPWSSGKVGDFESGRVSPTLTTLIALAGTLTDVTGQPVSLADLFAGDGRVQITPKTSMPLPELRAALKGTPVEFTTAHVEGLADELAASTRRGLDQLRGLKVRVNRGVLRAVLRDFTESDERLAKSLGAGRITAAAHMAKLWGRPFHAQRDHLAGPDANAQKRGRISRELKADLKAALDGDN